MAGRVRSALVWGGTAFFLLVAVLFFGLSIARVVKRGAPARTATLAEAPTLPHRPSPLAVRADWVADAGGGAVVLDPRGRSSYEGGHLPGAISAPAETLMVARDIRAALGSLGLSGREALVIAGDTASVGEEGKLFWLLELAGADSVRVLDGGLEAWVAAGHDLQTGGSPPRRAIWSAPPDSSRVASLGYVRDNYGLAGIEIIDARGEAVWGSAQVVEPGQWGRAGHIPNALPLDPRAMLGPHGMFRDVASMLSILVKSGPRPASPLDANSEFVVYDDGSGSVAPMLYMLLRMAGIDRVRFDTGGWAAWAGDPALPVVRIASLEEVWRLVDSEAGPGDGDRPLHSVLFLDVRNDTDFRVGHIPGALCLPSHLFADSLDLFLARTHPGIDRAVLPLLSYCYGPDCIRSRNCTTLAARAGFRNLLWFRGGMEEWERAQRRVVKVEARPQS